MSTIDFADLRHALCEAHALGAEFRVVGAAVEIDGNPLPETLRARLPTEGLWAFLGGARADNEALDFADALGPKPVLVTDRVSADAAMAALSEAPHLGLDFETAVPGSRPLPVKINKDGALSARQDAKKAEEALRPGLDPYQAEPVLAQLYGGGDTVYVFRGEALRHLLDSAWLRQQHLVAHNAPFELAFLRQHSAPPAGTKAAHPLECTLQATGLLFGTWGRGLAEAALKVFGAAPPKTLQTSAWSAPHLSPGQLAYAASDAVLTWHLWSEMRPALEELGRFEAYRLQRDVVPAVADMQLRGLGFDGDEHARQVEAWSRELAEERHAFLELAGEPAPSTPNQVRAWLANVAGSRLATWRRTDSGELSIERKYLKRLALSAIPTAKPMLRIMALEKLISTFGAGLRSYVNPVTGRIHSSYRVAAAKAGRFTASQPNLQQLPAARAPDFRRVIVAAPGCVLVGGDWSQIELRAAAWISGDPALSAVYEQGRDLHAETAALVAGIPVEAVTKEQRQAAKPVNFGSIYGVGPRTLAENAFDEYGVDMTQAEARAALDRFFATYSILHDWMGRHADLCQRRGRVEIGCGRVVEAAWEPGGRLSSPQCCNLPVQGAAADAMLRALPMVYRRLRGTRGGLVASVHDEILLEVTEDDAAVAAEILTEAMTVAFEKTFPGAPTRNVVEVRVGRTWRELK